MNLPKLYANAKASLLADASICSENRELFRQFFEYEEYKLKRQNGLQELDDGCCKTLHNYTILLRTTNRWFGNKPVKSPESAGRSSPSLKET